MVIDEKGTLRAVKWSEIFPWLSLSRVFRLAISARLLLLGALGVLLVQLGWYVAGVLLVQRDATVCPWLEVVSVVPNRPGLPAWDLDRPESISGAAVQLTGPMYLVWSQVSSPVAQLFRLDGGVAVFAYAPVALAWMLLVWSLIGSAITRTAAVRLAADEQLSWSLTLGHVKSKWRAYFAAPLFPLAGVLLAALPMGLLGLLLRLDIGVLLLSLVWFLYLFGGLVMAVLLLGLMFGWPLMWATISTEGTDSFDALSRSYAYVFQRPLHYLFYAIVAGIIGLLGWVLVYNFAASVVALAYWGASWGAGAERVALIGAGTNPFGPIGNAGIAIVHFWTGLVKLLAVGYLYSFFWVAATAIYLLLRQEVDATELDEVFLDDEAEDEQAGYALPPLATDEQGAPEVSPAEPRDAETPKPDEPEPS